jgi:hypothetical protein
MTLAVPCYPISVPLEVITPTWIYAASFVCELSGIVGFWVYRSVWLRDTSSMYQPVADLLPKATLVCQGIFEDDHMIHGEAEFCMYLLLEGKKP